MPSSPRRRPQTHAKPAGRNKSDVQDQQRAGKYPERINRDPYGAGGLVRLRVENWESETAGLVAGEAIAAAFEEAMRLENFSGPPAGA